jgi:hypothetical protein
VVIYTRMRIIGHRSRYRPEYGELTRYDCGLGAVALLAANHEGAHAVGGPEALDAERGSGNGGNSANLENPSKTRIGRADDFPEETCANLRELLARDVPVREAPGMPGVSAENAENAEIQRSPAKRASGARLRFQTKNAENAENPPAVFDAVF